MSFSPKATRRILSSTAAAAIIWGSGSAHAQNSYDAGDPTVVSGNVTFDRTGTANTEIYTINSNTAVLDFVPNDMGPGGPINFQAAGTEAQYRGGLAITDFTVLNRILANDPSRAIQFDGSVISRLQASPTTPGGSVWFYSPGGIIIGSSAVFDVGNLLLAAGDPTGGSGIIADPNQFSINSVPDSNAAITVQAGAQISATNPGSYVALVAPAIVQSGTVSTNGSAAYVAAEQTTLTFSSGLFNIQTTVGSNANNNTPLVHDGTTRFVDDAGQRRAYLVAVPKNDAITMLIQGAGQLGFDTATGVTLDNGVVVLGGGANVSDTNVNSFVNTPHATNLSVTGGTFNGDVTGRFNPSNPTTVSLVADGLGTSINFADDVFLGSGSRAEMVTRNGGTIAVGGNLDLQTQAFASREQDVTGGDVVIDASGGNITIGGNANLISSVNNNSGNSVGDPAGTVRGGVISLLSSNGSVLNIGGNLTADIVTNAAGSGFPFQTTAADVVGGTINLNALGGQISIDGSANLVADSFGGQAVTDGTTAGNGTGGGINIVSDNGSTDIAGSLAANVSGLGGDTQFGTNVNGGSGLGGNISLTVRNGGGLNIGSFTSLRADGTGRSGVGTGNGGIGAGGDIQLSSQDGTMNFTGDLTLNTDGVGGSGVNGGIGTGGLTNISANPAGVINFASRVTISTRGRGGQSDGVGNTGGLGQGGTAAIFSNGTVNFVGEYGSNFGGTGGNGLNGANGGDGFGGSGTITADSGTIRFDGRAGVRGSTFGGNISSGTGNAGNAQGGLAQMIATNGGSLRLLGTASGPAGDANVATSAFGGDGLFGSGSGGNGTGGTSNIFAVSGGTIDIAGFLLATASGFGGQDFFDPSLQYADLGGNGTGGTVSILANGGNIIGTSSVSALANGHGGLGVVEGGTATGGTVNVIAIDGLLDFSSGTDEMFLSMTGVGGDAVTETDGAGTVLRGGGNGGDGIGGNAFLLAGLGAPSNGLTGIVRAGDIRISENAAAPQGLSAVGGAGAAGAAGQGGGDGGDATGGVIFIGANNENGVFQVGNVTMGSLANAGAGGLGGLADGSGIFGNGGDGGDAFGRSIGLGANTDIGASTTGSAQFGDIIVNMAANGGNGGNAQGGNATGGTGGDAREGPQALSNIIAGPFILSRAMPVTLGDATLTANATGGDGGFDAGGARSAGGIAEGFATSISATFGSVDNQGRGSLVGNAYIGRAISMGGLGAGDVRANSFMGASGLSGLVGDVQLNTALLETRGIQQRTDIDPNEFAPYAFVAAIDGIVTVDGDVVMLSDNEFNLLPIGTGEINIGGNLNVTAGAGNSQAQSPFGDPVDEINVDGSVSLALGGDLVFGADIDVPGDFNATAGGVIQATNITAGSGITLQAGSSISTGNLLATNDISLTGMADEQLGLPANIVTGNITTQTGLINVVTNIGDITLGNLASPAAILINAGNGSTNANAGGDIIVGTVQGSDLNISGTDNLTIGGIGAAQSVNVAMTGLASFNGIAAAPVIVVTSGDIAIGTNGGLGGTNTSDLEINARAPDQPIFFGGDGSGGGYNLSASEATKLRSRSIRFNAQQVSGAEPADITIRDFTMQGSLAGANANLLASDLLINSPGNIRVTGAIRIENAGVEDSLGLSAESGRIEVVTDLGGSIAIADDSGLAGNLFLDANHIAVGTSDLLARLATDPRFTGRDAEVNSPDGSNRPEGYISAGSIQVDGFETIMIQNSGTETLRGGFSAGSGGFILDTENTTTGGVDAVVNGRIADDSGSFLTNDATLPAVGFEDPAEAALFSGGSQINGCVLNSGGCQIVTPTTPNQSEQPITIASDVREIIHEQGEASDSEDDDDQRAAELTPASTGKKSPIAPNIPVVNTNRLNSSPAVTDPITGSGNPNFISGELEIDLDPSPSLTDNGDS